MIRKIITYLENRNIFTSRIAFARLLMGLSALLTLLFNNMKILTDTKLLEDEAAALPPNFFSFKQYDIFELFGANWGTVISIIILIFVITGYYPKISILLQSWVHLSICNSLIVIEGGDQVASNLCLLLIPICLFDGRVNQWSTAKQEIVIKQKAKNVFFNVYYSLILIQVAAIYLHSAIGKLNKEDWIDGTCLYYWFTHNVYGAPVWLQNLYNFFTLSTFAPIFTWSIIILELGLFACILATNKFIKRIFLAAGILMHLGILITHGLFTFFFSMFGALILYLDTDNIIYTFLLKKFKYYANRI